MNIKIFISTHKENVNVPKNDLLFPIQVGTDMAMYKFPNMYHDNEGENISSKNASYCELTAQYWVWKNVEADYYGFFHYRRYFSFASKQFPTTHEPFVFDEVVFKRNDKSALETINLNEESMKSIIAQYDFVTSRASHSLTQETVYEQYNNSVGHHIEDLDAVISIIKNDYPEFVSATEKYLSGKSIYCCNMFIMKKELFMDYSKWLFDILEKHEKIRDISEYPPVDKRVSGYLAERLCGIYITYLYEKGYSGKELQRVYFKNTDVTKFPGVAGEKGVVSSAVGKYPLSLTIVCRGNGSIYGKVIVKKPLEEYKLLALSKNEKGVPILNTTSILRLGNVQDEWVLELPITDSDLLVSLKICDKNGNVYGALNKKVYSKIAKVNSKLNKTFNKQEVIDVLHNSRSLYPGLIKVELNAVIPDLNGTYIVHGAIKEMLNVQESIDDTYIVKGENENGADVFGSSIIFMKDKRKKMTEYPDYAVRSVEFSAKLNDLPNNLIVSVKRDQNSSFCTKERRVLETMICDWNNRIRTASGFANYHKWFLTTQRVSRQELILQSRRKFAIRPVYSIVVPIYNTPISFLEEMVVSVKDQSYGGWELILVNASPKNEKLRKAIEGFAKKDERIRQIILEKNLGITENTNRGMEVAKGDFICFLDHDDVLEKNTLYEYTKVINKDPQVDMLYCDEDKLNGNQYCDPYFKPDFNIDLLCGINYVCHFLTVRRKLVEEIERPSSIYDGAQDHNMTFRIAEKARAIAHVPKVLYHWRIHANSTASTPEEKPYTLEAARLSVQHHLERIGVNAKVVNSERVPRHYEVEYVLPEEHPLISIIIPNKNCKNILERCISSIIEKSTYDNFEIIIVDNDSDEAEVFDYYKTLQTNYSFIKIVSFPGEFNFPGEVNYGVKNSAGEYIVLLNNDTEVITPGWLEKMLGPCMRKEMGAVGAKLLFADGTVQHAGIVINQKGPMHLNYSLPRLAPGYYDTARLSMNLSAVTGACLMSKKSVYESVGGFDENFKIDYNDVDYCLKLREKGLLVLYEAGVELYHHESVTRDEARQSKREKERFCREKSLLMQKWPGYFIEGDPYYNKNFKKNNTYYCI